MSMNSFVNADCFIIQQLATLTTAHSTQVESITTWEVQIFSWQTTMAQRHRLTPKHRTERKPIRDAKFL